MQNTQNSKDFKLAKKLYLSKLVTAIFANIARFIYYFKELVKDWFQF
jgi:hypothetical protein